MFISTNYTEYEQYESNAFIYQNVWISIERIQYEFQSNKKPYWL